LSSRKRGKNERSSRAIDKVEPFLEYLLTRKVIRKGDVPNQIWGFYNSYKKHFIESVGDDPTYSMWLYKRFRAYFESRGFKIERNNRLGGVLCIYLTKSYYPVYPERKKKRNPPKDTGILRSI
jgi:hypothetical protein